MLLPPCHALARLQAAKVYVQHRMREVGPALVHLLLHKGAFLFVCGDGAKMAKDVKDTLRELLQVRRITGTGVRFCLRVALVGGRPWRARVCVCVQEHAGYTSAEADSKITEMRSRHKYVEDIWS
jgi:sulfite reductase alpha subunit-like flavoprotein